MKWGLARALAVLLLAVWELHAETLKVSEQIDMPFGPDGQYIQTGTVDVGGSVGFFVLNNENVAGGARAKETDPMLVRFTINPLSFKGLQISPIDLSKCNGILHDTLRDMVYVYGSDSLLDAQFTATVAEVDAFNVTKNVEMHSSFQTLTVGPGFTSAFLNSDGSLFANSVSSLQLTSTLFSLNMTVPKGKQPVVLGESVLKQPPGDPSLDNAYTYGALTSIPASTAQKAADDTLVFVTKGCPAGVGEVAVDDGGAAAVVEREKAAPDVRLYCDELPPDEAGAEVEATLHEDAVAGEAGEGDDLKLDTQAPFLGKFFSTYPWPSISSTLSSYRNVSLYEMCYQADQIVTLSAQCSSADGVQECNEFVVTTYDESGIGFTESSSFFLIQLNYVPPNIVAQDDRPSTSLVCLPQTNDGTRLVAATIYNYLFVVNLGTANVSHLHLPGYAEVQAFMTQGYDGTTLYASGTNFSRRDPPNSILSIDVSD